MTVDPLSLTGLIIGVIGIVLAFFGIDHKMVRAGVAQARPTRREIVVTLIALATVGFVFYRSLVVPHGRIQYIAEWGAGPNPNSNHVTVDSSLLKPYASHYRLAAICFLWSNADEGDIPLQKSALYDITGARIVMDIPWGNSLYYENLNKGARDTSYSALLVPKEMTMDQFSTLRQAKAMGVIELDGKVGPP